MIRTLRSKVFLVGLRFARGSQVTFCGTGEVESLCDGSTCTWHIAACMWSSSVSKGTACSSGCKSCQKKCWMVVGGEHTHMPPPDDHQVRTWAMLLWVFQFFRFVWASWRREGYWIPPKTCNSGRLHNLRWRKQPESSLGLSLCILTAPMSKPGTVMRNLSWGPALSSIMLVPSLASFTRRRLREFPWCLWRLPQTETKFSFVSWGRKPRLISHLTKCRD